MPNLAGYLLIHNLHINGLKALLYCYGLSASRYVEYSTVISFLSAEVTRGYIMLDLGCGHSAFPILCQNHLSEIVALDQNAIALKWQNRKATKGKRGLHTVLADMRLLPFKNRSIDAVSSVSAIEHIPGDGDIDAASEIGRVLRTGGVCLISFPLSQSGRTVIKEKWTAGVPRVIHRLFGFAFHQFSADSMLIEPLPTSNGSIRKEMLAVA